MNIDPQPECSTCQRRAEWAKSGRVLEVTLEERIEHLERRMIALELEIRGD